MAVVKAAAEWTSFKLCQLLLATGSSLDAAFQLRLLLSALARLQLLRSPLQWRHSEWLSRQHLLFAQLLLAHRVRGALDLDPGLHLHRAATLSLRRKREIEAAAALSVPRQSVEQLLAQFPGFSLAASRYLGGLPYLEREGERQSLALSVTGQELLLAVLARTEAAVDHCGAALALLQQALSATEDKFLRRRAVVRSSMAEVELLRGDPNAAFEQLTALAALQLEQGWALPAADSLRRLLLCARAAGRWRDLVQHGFKLYGLRGLSLQDLRHLHDELFAVLTEHSQSQSPSSPDVSEIQVPVNDEAPLMDVSVTFSASAASVGDSMELLLKVRSRLVQGLRLSEVVLSYSDGQTRQRILHCEPADTRLQFDDTGAAQSPLILHPDRPLRVRAEFVVTPAHLRSASETELFVSQVDIVVPLDRIANSGADQSVPPSSANDDEFPQQRRLVFRCTNLDAVKALARHPEGISPADIAKAYRQARNCFLTVRRRTALLRLDVIPRELLQGVVGRVDLELRTNGDDIFDGSLALESPSSAPSNPVFWLPAGKGFHPMRETSNPVSPISVKIPPIASDRVEVLPLFIRSITPGSLTLRLTAKYLTGRFRSEVQTDSEVVLVVAEPVRVRFSITNPLGFPRGVSREVLANSVARGDIVTLTATVECPPELKQGVHVSKLELHSHSDNDNAFTLKGGSDMLHGGVGDLSPGEVLAGCTQLQCTPSRHDDKPLLNGLKANRSAFIGSVMVEVSQPANAPNSSDLGLLESLPIAGLVDGGVSVSDRGTIFFYIPPVNLVDCPFDVEFSHAACVAEGEAFSLIVGVGNKLNSIARVHMKLDLDGRYLVTGETSRTTEVRRNIVQVSFNSSRRSFHQGGPASSLSCCPSRPASCLCLPCAFPGTPGARTQ